MPTRPRRALLTALLALSTALLAPATAWSAPTWDTFKPDDSVPPRIGGTLVALPDGTTLLIGGLTSGKKSGDPDATLDSVVRINPAAKSPDTPLEVLPNKLVTARTGHTATLLPDGRVLVVGGLDSTGAATTSVEVGEAIDGVLTWHAVASLGVARAFHTATVLATGRVLVVGGRKGGGDLASAESFDPFAKNNDGKWNGVAPLPTGNERSYHTATLLPDGRVLVAGGAQGTGALSSTWLLDPKAPSGSPWKPDSPGGVSTLQLSTQRAGHTAVLMPSGQVLLVGGCNEAPLDLDVCSRPSKDEYFTPGDVDAWAVFSAQPPLAEGLPGKVSTPIFGQAVVGLRNGWVMAAFGHTLHQGDTTPGDLRDVFTLRPISADPAHDPIGPILQSLSGTWHWAAADENPVLGEPPGSPYHGDSTAVVDARGGVVLANGRQGQNLVRSVDYLGFVPDGGKCTPNDGGFECAGGVCLCDDDACLQPTCQTPRPNGSLCDRDPDCESRSCEPTTDQAATVCCAFSCPDKCASDGAGVMVGTCGDTACDKAYKSCKGYRCQADACLEHCAVHSDCSGGFYCQSSTGTCVPVEANGFFCVDDASKCQSGQCVEGVCCDMSCTGFCESCRNLKTGQAEGLCAHNTSGTAPKMGFCGTTDNVCGNTGMCDGQGECALAVKGTACDSDEGPAPRNGFECDGPEHLYSIQKTCSGSGKCGDVPIDCGMYRCDANSEQCAFSCDPALSGPDGVNGACHDGFLCGGTTRQCGSGSQCLSSTTFVKTTGDGLTTESCQFNRLCLESDPEACVQKCRDSTDCMPGMVCRTSGSCTEPVAPSSDSPDCFCAQPGPARPSAPGLLAALVGLGALGVRRRRVRPAARASR